ncbi:hypothetical protein [Pseudochryseolinea flava]|uniref:Uncharacterized protein n=1 Tax=Pseudochryseolinea flava TaxID=2059302 RepID=A0A364Y8C4_9BACT|nr:hypothetical protein [Pseudochryseolinea flava]RAW03237.1 hypothetical protein DQQ10_03890 [Pseudochryseolinea flava]
MSAKKNLRNSCLSNNFFTYLLAEFAHNNGMAVSKKKVIKSLENLSEDLKDLLRDQYPNGYEGSITRITNAKKEPIFVFPLETEDATYLIKVPATKNSEGEYDVESKPEGDDDGGDDDYGSSSGGSDDDDFGNSGSSSGDDYDDDGGGRKSGREQSYDPDFDA